MAKRFYLHTISGQVGRLDEQVAEHPTFKPYLVEVEPGTKSFNPDFYKPQTAAEYLVAKDKKSKTEKDPEDKK